LLKERCNYFLFNSKKIKINTTDPNLVQLIFVMIHM